MITTKQKIQVFLSTIVMLLVGITTTVLIHSNPTFTTVIVSLIISAYFCKIGSYVSGIIYAQLESEYLQCFKFICKIGAVPFYVLL